MRLKKPNQTEKGNHALGQLTAIAMGLGVATINAEKGHELLPSSIAGLKQYFYSAVVAVMFITAQEKIYDHLSEKKQGSFSPDVISILTPALATILLTYILHSLKGTPEPIASTIPTVILAPIGYTILHTRRILNEFDDLEIEL